MRSGKRGAGAGATGQRDARAPLPHAHAKAPRRNHICELHIGARRKQLVMFDLRTQFRDLYLFGTVGEYHAMRISDRNGGGNPALPTSAQCKSVGLDFARQRDVSPTEFRRSHVHRNRAISRIATGEQAAARIDADGMRAFLRDQKLCHATRRVAAGFHLVPVGVEYPHDRVDTGVCPFHDDYLVAADATAPVGDPARGRLVKSEVCFARIEYDEIVAEPVHLVESRHGKAYRVGKRTAHLGRPRFDFHTPQA